ncbi:hypothetical protein N0V90_009894 [Kalmusia sp. IMI 367209]|nr:hypothetical protein N0V90_009894 [Kalmusia sp. IMI 367209]
MSATEAKEQDLPTPGTSAVDPLERNDVASPGKATQPIVAEDAKSKHAPEANDSTSSANTGPQGSANETGSQLRLADLESLILKLQLDHNKLLEKFDSLQGGRRRRSRVRSASPGTPPPPEASFLGEKPIIQPRLNPQFWGKYQEPEPEPKHVCAIDLLIGDPELSSSGKDSVKRIRSGTVDNARSSRKHSGPNEDEEALKELERIKGKYMPDQARINVFSIQYLLRVIFGEQANIPHEHSRKGIVILRPYKNILKNETLLKEKLSALTRLIEDYENEKKTEAMERRKKAEATDTELENPNDGNNKTDKEVNGEPQDGDAEDGVSSQQGPHELSDKPFSVDITVDAIDDMLARLELFCCAECNKMLQEDFRSTNDAKAIIKCLSDLVEGFLIPVHDNYRKRTPAQVSFSHLWHIFQPGDHLVMKRDPDSDYDSSNWYASLWRVLRVQGGRRELCKEARPPVGPPPLHSQARQPPAPPHKVNGMIPFTIDTYHLDHDGFTIVPVRRRFFIMPFTGERKITELEVFPLEYASDRHASKDTLIERGRKFVEYVSSKKTGYHLDCRGSDLQNKTERLDEQMIVDMEDYWGDPRNTGRPAYSAPEPLDARETSHFCYAFEPCETSSQIPFVVDHYIDQDFMDEDIKDRFLFSDYNERRLKEKLEMNDNDFAICTHRLYGWLLRSRKWGTVHIDSVAKVHRPRSDLSFNQLVLPPETKEMIQSQVQEHFRRKRSQTKSGGQGLDLVGGKGLGLTILIHGAPGVGKTATAECVADLVEKPLYPLTCGDMGSNAKEIESNLSYHLYAATRWDCILLLDEADVFMAKRTKEDYARNATVSVFLRMLEYYKGVLILTTNRIGTFDEAFKSRIHLSLFYPNFDEDDTVAVFKVFIQRTKKTYAGRRHLFDIDTKAIKAFAREHYNRVSEDARWNGRQIRNAFHTALAMAEYDARTKIAGLDPTDPNAYGKDCEVTVKLGRSQFEAVANTVALFDDYLEETMGVSHATRLENEKVRKKKTHVREKKKEKEDEEKELRRRLEAIKKSKAKDQGSDSDDTDSSEDEKPKSRKKKEKAKEKERAAKRRAQLESSTSNSD